MSTSCNLLDEYPQQSLHEHPLSGKKLSEQDKKRNLLQVSPEVHGLLQLGDNGGGELGGAGGTRGGDCGGGGATGEGDIGGKDGLSFMQHPSHVDPHTKLRLSHVLPNDCHS